MNVIARLRRFARTGPAGLVIPAGLVLAFFVAGLMQSVAEGVVMPLIANAYNSDGPARDFNWTVARMTFRFWNIIEDAVVLIVLVGLAYVLALRPVANDPAPAPSPRCPECRDTIVAGATRCPSCRFVLGEAD